MAQQVKKSVFKSVEGKTAILSFYDKLLEGWPVTVKKHTVSSRHGDIFIIECGDVDKPALVLLHGSGSNSALWAGEIKEYIDHFRVLAVDLPGEPGHSCEYRPDLFSSAYAEFMEDVMNELEIKQAAFIGNSLGAWAAPYSGKIPIFSDDELKKLTMPVMVTVGEEDIMLDQRKTARRIAALLPEAKINLLPGTRHFILEQQKRNIEFLTSC